MRTSASSARSLLGFLSTLAVFGCGNPAAVPVVRADAGSQDTCGSASDTGAGAAPGFGERCDPQVGCAMGLTCQSSEDSEFAPFSWCTRACNDFNHHCDEADLGGRKGLCIQMPEDWRGPKTPFCAPECGTKGDCKGLEAGWETCGEPKYKGVPLPGASSLSHICQAPSSHGAVHVDPVTCAWEGSFTDNNKFGEAKAVAKKYCDMLNTCKLRSACTTPACCTWHAFQYLIPKGPSEAVDNKRIAELKCYPQSVASHLGSPSVCTAWLESDDCGELPVK